MHILNPAIEYADLPINLKNLLRCLASHCGTRTVCWPGERRIAAYMNCSTRTVQRYLRMAIDGGYVEVKRRYLRSNLYRLKCLVERVATPSCRIEQSIQEKRTSERVDSKDHDHTNLLREFRAVMGKHVFRRNIGWFKRLIRTIAHDTLVNGIEYVKSAIRDSEDSHEKIKSPSALLTWFLRKVGALPHKETMAPSKPASEDDFIMKPTKFEPPTNVATREQVEEALGKIRKILRM